jgi:hypothetical protein
MLLGYI